jgi:DNA polymerase III delta subunit
MDKIYYSDNGIKKEAKGEKLQEILALQKEVNDEELFNKTAKIDKESARASAIKKLAEIAGLTEEELASIL